jgi:hypothetical protein
MMHARMDEYVTHLAEALKLPLTAPILCHLIPPSETHQKAPGYVFDLKFDGSTAVNLSKRGIREWNGVN